MYRFNLTFKGEIQPGYDLEKVKSRLAKLLEINDPDELEQLFTGELVLLKRDLDRKTAADFYAKLNKLGAEAALVKYSADSDDASEPAEQVAPVKTPAKAVNRGMDTEILQRQPGQVDQSWAVSSTVKKLAVTGGDKTDAKRRAREEAERNKQRIAEARLRADEEAVRLKKSAQEAKRRADAEAARQRALEAERRRWADEEAARKKSEAAQARRKADAEAARLRAAEAEEKRKEREAAARQRKDAAAEQRRQLQEKRKAEEAAAREQALAAEQARNAALATAERERKAAAEQKRKLAAEQRKEELAAQNQAKAAATSGGAKSKAKPKSRAAGDKPSRRKTSTAESKSQANTADASPGDMATADAARQAEEVVEQQRLAEQQRIADELAASQQRAAEAKRRADEAAARQRAHKAEQERRALAEQEQAEREQAKEEKAKREQAEREQAKQERAKQEKAEREQAEQEQTVPAPAVGEATAIQAVVDRNQAPATAGKPEPKLPAGRLERRIRRQAVAIERRAQQAEVQAQRSNIEQTTIDRAARALRGGRNMVKTVRAKVRTRLALPQGQRLQPSNDSARRQHPLTQGKRQPGEPNLYRLRPFRNTADIRLRSEHSRQRLQIGYGVAALALGALLIVGLRFLTLPATALIQGPQAAAATSGGELVLISGDVLLLHDRAGVGKQTIALASLELQSIERVLGFDSDDQLIVQATPRVAEAALLAEDDSPTAAPASQMLRCDLDEIQCEPWLAQLQPGISDAMVTDQRTGSLFLAQARQQQLLKINPDGKPAASASAPLATHPQLQLLGGLLFSNSAEGPAISVFRYDDDDFGEQLDEILLLPAAAVAAGQTAVRQLIHLGDNWWVTLYHPDTLATSLFRFDEKWNELAPVVLPPDFSPQQLLQWGEKLLVLDPRRPLIQRFNDQGAAEVPLDSDLLNTMRSQQQGELAINSRLWHFSLLILAITAVGSFCFGYLHRLRSLVYRRAKTMGAEPLEAGGEIIQWLHPAAERDFRLRLLITLSLALCASLVLLGIVMRIEPAQMLALLLALSGPLIWLMLLKRGRSGHIGLLQDRLLLVDHLNRYHLGGGPRIMHHHWYLMIDDVLVYTGPAWLPAFDPRQLRALVAPLAKSGIKVDYQAVLVRLVESRHPLALGALATIITSLLAVAALLV